MLSPMLVQYLVALCCLRRNPSAVDITIGQMVLDEAAAKKRDVDVTVTVDEGEGVRRAFKVFEVKNEKRKLDVIPIEGLCAKLNDMSSVTHKSIVSASGYTESAIKKAKSHCVELFTIEPWSGDLAKDFPGFGMSGAPDECLVFGGKTLLCWAQAQLQLIAPTHPGSFAVEAGTALHQKSGKRHSRYATFAAYAQELLLRSTEFLFPLQPAVSVAIIFPLRRIGDSEFLAASPAWPHSHTVDVRSDGVYIDLSGRFVQIEAITIHGQLQWQRKDSPAAYHVVKRIPDGTPYAGAMVIDGQRDGEMACFVVAPDSRTAGIHLVRLEKKHQNAIRELKLIHDGKIV